MMPARMAPETADEVPAVAAVGRAREHAHVVEDDQQQSEAPQGEHEHRHPPWARGAAGRRRSVRVYRPLGSVDPGLGVTRLLATGVDDPSTFRFAGFAMAARVPATDRARPSGVAVAEPGWSRRSPGCRRRIRCGARRPAPTLSDVGARILVIDNYDSFVYNLVQYLGELGADPVVHRDDAIDLADVERDRPRRHPDLPRTRARPTTPGCRTSSSPRGARAGRSSGCASACSAWARSSAARWSAPRRWCTARRRSSATATRACSRACPNPLEATRYHSLIVERSSLPDELEITAETDDGLIMGLRHRELMVEGVQFHPESVLTASGHALVDNFLRRCTAATV